MPVARWCRSLVLFCLLKDRTDLPYNLLLAATAEEEISGANGIASILPELGPISCGIVGEPTSLDVAIAERGLIVIDGKAKGLAGHAARKKGLMRSISHWKTFSVYGSSSFRCHRPCWGR